MLTEREKRVLAYWNTRIDKQYTYENQFLEDAKEFVGMFKDCLVIREAANPVNGVADLLLCYKGNFIAAELKRQNGIASHQQVKFIEKVLLAGGRGAICRTLNDIWYLMK